MLAYAPESPDSSLCVALHQSPSRLWEYQPPVKLLGVSEASKGHSSLRLEGLFPWRANEVTKVLAICVAPLRLFFEQADAHTSGAGNCIVQATPSWMRNP